MEGVQIWNNNEMNIKQVEIHLKETLVNLVQALFGTNIKYRWNNDSFPFTFPSFELEIYFNDQWLEILGCGIIHPQVLTNANLTNQIGWAFGIGLERLAMILFDIPDIRLFWTTEPRFLTQFSKDKSIQQMKFQAYSKYPACFKDISFWINQDKFHINDLSAVIRDIAGDLVEELKLVDIYKKDNQISNCWRISFRSMDRSLTDQEINKLYFQIRDYLQHNFDGIDSLR